MKYGKYRRRAAEPFRSIFSLENTLEEMGKNANELKTKGEKKIKKNWDWELIATLLWIGGSIGLIILGLILKK